MKKLTCSSCGGKIEVKDDKEFGVCPFCGTEYKLNEDVNINIKMDDNFKQIYDDTRKEFKSMNIFFRIIPIIAIIIFGVIIYNMLTINNHSFNSDSDNGKYVDEMESVFKKNEFNMNFTYASGRKDLVLVENILDNIVSSNKQHERKITFSYENTKTTDPDEIVKIKNSLKDGEYEVSINYDNEGYVNEISISYLEN